MSFPLPILYGSDSAQDGVPEDAVCSVDSQVCCEPDAGSDRSSPGATHPKASGLLWVTDSRFPGTVVALQAGQCSPSLQAPQVVHGFQNPVPSPPYEEDCSRGLRSFVDVLDSLM